MALADLTVVITNHAFQQYCDRVEYRERDSLTQVCQEQMQQYDRREREFVQLKGVWWVFNIHDDKLIFVTCYGRTNMDIPAALKWAKAHNDRIVLETVQEAR